jgi:hypothetical protein
MNMLLSACPNAFAQRLKVIQAGCSLIDKRHPSQFISYEGVSQSKSEVKLRLYNNSSCNIIVETDDRDPVRLLSKNGLGADETRDIQDNVWIPLHYLIQDRRRWKAPEPAFGWGDSVFTYELLAGHSALFTVQLSHFKKHLDVVVPFNYAWEVNTTIAMGVGGVVHRVYFLREGLPRSMLGNNP